MSRTPRLPHLHQEAEARLQGEAAGPGGIPPEDTRRLLHELQVHQVELELQNGELRRAQAELAAVQERYFDFYDQAPVGYLNLDAAGLVLDANLTAAALLGVERKRLDGQPFNNFILAEDQDSYHLLRQRLSSTPETQVCELRLARQGSAPLWVQLVVNAVRESKSSTSRYRVVMTDITQRRQAEDALQHSERDFSSLVENAPDMISRFDTGLRYVYCSPAVEQQLGMPPDALIGKTPSETSTPPEQAEFVIKWLKRTLETGEMQEIERSRQTPNGLKHFQIHIAPERDSQGNIVSLLAISHDITARKQAEEEIRQLSAERAAALDALREYQAKQSALIENTGDLIWAVDTDYCLIVGNSQFSKWIAAAFKSEIALGESVLVNSIPPAMKDEWRGYYERALGGETFSIEKETLFSETPRILDYRFHPITSAAGTISGVVVSGRDVTKRVQAEETLRQSEQRLRIRDQINTVFLTCADEEMYAEILRIVLRETGSEFGIFGYFNEDGSFIVPTLVRQTYWEMCHIPGKEIIFQKGPFLDLWARAIQERKTLYSNEGPFKTPRGHIPIRNTLVTPIIYKDQVISALHLANKAGGYAEQDQKLVEMIAAKIAPVLYARLERDRQNQARLQAEAAMLESETHYRNLANSIGDVFFAMDHDLRYTFWNQASEKLMGILAGDAIGRSIQEVFADTPEIRQAVTMYLEVLRTQHPRSFIQETRLAGRAYHFEISAYPSEQGVSVITRDISGRRQMEATLRQRERDYSSLVENAPDMISRFDTSLHLVYCNPAVEQNLGISAERLIGKTPLETDRPLEEAERLTQGLMRVLETGAEQETELIIPAPGGLKHTFHARIVPERGPQGSIDSLLVVARDMTSLKQAEAALQASEERFRAIADYTYNWENWVAPDGRLLWVNPAVERMTGYTPEEYMRLPERIRQVAVAEDKERLLAFFEKGVQGKQSDRDFEFRIQRKDGSTLWAAISYQPIYSAAGDYMGLRSSVHDISRRKQAEEEIARLNTELEQRVAQRTAELAQANRELQTKICELEHTQNALQSVYTQYRIVADNTHDWEFWLDPDGQFIYTSPSCKCITGYEKEDFLSNPGLLAQIMHPDNLPAWQAHRAKEAAREITGQIELRIRCADGSTRWIGHVCQPVFDDQGRFLGTRGSNRDISERKQADEKIRSHAARAEILARSAAQLNARLELADVLQTVCAAAAGALNVPMAIVHLYNEQNDELELAASFGFPPDFQQRHTSFRRAAFEQIAAQFAPATVGVVDSFSNLPDLPDVQYFLDLGIASAAGAMISHQQQLIGVLSLYSRGAERQFTADELALLQGLADQVAQAIVNARLYEQVSLGRQRLRILSQALMEVQESERRSLALELHDELGQMLSSAKMSLDMIPTLPQAAAGEQLQRAGALVGDLVTRVRRMSLELRPSMLDDMGLLAALRWLFKNYQIQSGEAVLFEYTDLEQRFPPLVEITAYRIVQEALTNVLRHAGANKQVYVNAWSDGQSLNLNIEDHGVGFDLTTTTSRSESSGLSGMRERARLLDGEMIIESAPGEGASVTIRLPLASIHESA